ncbi:MAG: tetratricopeptide repeat protein [Sandaracinaceae bacterium]
MTYTRTIACLFLLAGCGQPSPPEPDPLAEGWRAARAGDHEGAATHYARAVAAHPEDPAAWMGSAREALRNTRPAEAREAATRAVAIAPESADAHELLGRALRALPTEPAEDPEPADATTAADELARALELAPDRSRLHFPLARALERSGDPDGAIEAYRAAAEAGVQPGRTLAAAVRTRLDALGNQPASETLLRELEQELDRAAARADGDDAAEGAIRSLRRRIARKRVPAPRTDSMRPASVREIARNAGLLGALQNSELSGVFGSAAAPGEGPNEALGALMGSPIEPGFGGLGTRGTGRGGGGTGEGTIGLGNLGRLGGPRSRPPRERGEARQGEVRVSGALPDAEARRVVRRFMSQVRYCYERARTRDADLAGALTLSLDVTADGTTTRAHVVSSTIGTEVERWGGHARTLPERGRHIVGPDRLHLRVIRFTRSRSGRRPSRRS